MQHTRSPPYHPQSNGQAERFADTFKRALLKSREEGITDEMLQDSLFVYRTTSNLTTIDGRSPAETPVGRKLRTVHHALIPTNALTQAPGPNFNNRFATGEAVYKRDYRPDHNSWTDASMSACHGKMYDVSVSGTIWKRHRYKLRPRHTNAKATDAQHLLLLDILLNTFAIPDALTDTVPSSYAAGSSDKVLQITVISNRCWGESIFPQTGLILEISLKMNL
ncbi:uncharacterized protein DEA37_0003222 [Paragonimus westermani]|uniref:Integrase catalytic domain-containing protein n=1 Tax=Paragonimus westermani TaxID=34504 RepID=A0A5J4NKW2_9TREM|nr:uncharacterized protein DEA37_0003222 [Paragonimus westermani]